MNFKRIIVGTLITTMILTNSLISFAETDITVPPTTEVPQISSPEEAPAYGELVDISTPDDNDSSDNDSSSGSGGSRPKPSTPDTELDDKVAEELDDLANSKKPSEELADKATDVIESIDVESSKNADKKVSEISDTIASVVKNLDSEEAIEVVEELSQLAGKALENENVSAEEAKDMVTDLIKTSFSALVSKEDVDLESTKEDITELVEKAIEKAATVEVTKGTVTNDKVEYVIDENLIAGSILLATETRKDLADTLESNGLLDVADDANKNINLKLPESESDVSLDIDIEAISELGDNNFGLTVEAKGIDISLPAELLNTATKGITIESKPVAKDVKLANNTSGGTTEELKTLDIDVSNGSESVKGLVELSFSLADLADVDLDTLMVGVFEDGVWTKLAYEIKDGKVVFTAPHFSIYSLMKYETAFEDVKDNWAKKYITSLAAKGIVSGRDDSRFDPQNTITRAEFVTLLVNHLGLDNKVTSNYKDVEEGTWYYDIIGRAGINSITAGTINGNFRPNENITREEMAVMLAKAYKAKYGYDMTGETLTFTDKSEISEYALQAIAATKTSGVISGYPDNTFRPLATATRAEAATMMYLFLEQ